MKRIFALIAVTVMGLAFSEESDACTGISLTAQDGSRVVARTVEWAATPMQCGYVVCPRNHQQQSYTPSGADGMKYTSVFGYVGIYTEYEPFVVEGVNEAGLSAGLFFFPNYGQYTPYNVANKDSTICDMQFVSWVLSQFDSIDEVKAALKKVHVVTLNHKIGAVHWRIAQPDGKMVVLEFVNGTAQFYENKLGVLTNSPGFQWHMTNLNNYINLEPGSAPDHVLKPGITLMPLGHGSGMLGLPGDFTSPSRFIRATFYQTTAPQLPTGFDTVVQAFHILNNFDIPIGTQHVKTDVPKGLPSATQFTAVTDQEAMRLYYRTAWNSDIRCIDLMNINFHKVKYQSHPLDNVTVQPIQIVKVK
jgi:choloylglycine hydrolase